MKKPLFAIFATAFLVVVVVSVFSLPVSAAIAPGYEVPVYTGSASAVTLSDMLPLWSSGGVTYGAYLSNSVPGDTVACSYPGYILVLSVNQPSGYYINYRAPHNQGGSDSNSYNSVVVDGVTYYQNQKVVPSGASIVCDSFDSYQSALNGLVAALNYTPDPEPGPEPSPSLNDGGTNLSVSSAYPITVVVPAGYVLCVEGDLGSIRFDQSFDDYSALFQVSGFWWWGSSAFTRDSAGIPDIGSSYSINPDGSSRIAFLKSQPQNFAGQSRNGYLIKEYNNAGDFLLIFNPQINWYNDHGLAQTNHDLIVTFRSLGGVDSIRAFPISSPTYSYLGNEYIDCTVTGEPYFLSLSGLWRDPTQSSNLVSLPHAQNGDEQTSVLDGLVSDIDSLVSGLWSHIRTLSDLLGQFPDAIVSIYSWLPSDYRALLACLFGISCTIGVLKVLL